MTTDNTPTNKAEVPSTAVQDSRFPKGYIPSLDGIRALAMVVVVFSHTGYGDFVPGRAGVTIFFFLSGYLITTLMLREFEKKGTIEIKKFFARRFIRLLPPVLVVLPVVYLFALVDWIPGEASLKSFFSQLFYMANYFEINAGPNDRPAGLVVLWSLAIEEHFYVLYPLIFLPFVKQFSFPSLGSVRDGVGQVSTGLKRFAYWKVAAIFAVMCGTCLLWRIYLVSQPGDIGDRTAFGTDTRFESILWGCILGLTQLTEKMKNLVNSKKLPLQGYGLLALGGIAFGLTLVIKGEFFRESIRYSIQGIALLPVFYYAVVYHQSPFFKFLELSVLKKLGIYSYVIYLTHYSIYHLLKTNFSLFESKIPVTIATFVLSVAVAAFFDSFIDARFKSMRKSLR